MQAILWKLNRVAVRYAENVLLLKIMTATGTDQICTCGLGQGQMSHAGLTQSGYRRKTDRPFDRIQRNVMSNWAKLDLQQKELAEQTNLQSM